MRQNEYRNSYFLLYIRGDLLVYQNKTIMKWVHSHSLSNSRFLVEVDQYLFTTTGGF